MADVFTRKKRSEIMSRVKGRGNLATEIRLMHAFRKYGVVGWRRRARLLGNPDFIFPASKFAIFVDGCFWHGCPRHGTIPQSNHEFWLEKLTRNKTRDRLVNRQLKMMGWIPIRIWQHELQYPGRVIRRLSRIMGLQYGMLAMLARAAPPA